MDEIKDINKVNEPKEVVLTEAQWKMLRHIRQGAKVFEAYQLAGFDGKSPNAPYVMYNTIKRKLQEVIEADGFDKVRLSMEMEKLLSLPLVSDKLEVTFGEKLKALRLAHTIINTNEIKQPNQSFSVIIIENGTPANPLIEKTNMGKVIDAEVIKPSEPLEPSS